MIGSRSGFRIWSDPDFGIWSYPVFRIWPDPDPGGLLGPRSGIQNMVGSGSGYRNMIGSGCDLITKIENLTFLAVFITRSYTTILIYITLTFLSEEKKVGESKLFRIRILVVFQRPGQGKIHPDPQPLYKGRASIYVHIILKSSMHIPIIYTINLHIYKDW